MNEATRRPNRLIHETSPYLLQHAYNPVDWHPWGEEALELARRGDKPILLSIGYSACHWCHVMERESFENEEIAEAMNRGFVNIKVDREERPDLDALYMMATQAIAGQGGWPMTVFLTPDQRPFYAGTYFPPEDRYGRPGFPRVLKAVTEYYETQRASLDQQTERIAQALQNAAALPASDEASNSQTLNRAFWQLMAEHDKYEGGFGRAPKFPQPSKIELCLRHYKRTGDENALGMASATLLKMARGGLYDQLGGGFHRYSTDDRWLVPHFEKMLYDNALLPPLYLSAWQLTGEAEFADAARGCLEYALREMQDERGGFYSAEDADSEGVEGKFYVWTRAEVLELLGEEDGGLFCAYYDISEGGNWEGSSILNRPRGLEEAASTLGASTERLREAAARGRERLFEARERRIRPSLDDKILTSWNGLMISALSQGAFVLGEARYLEAAERAARFVLENMTREGLLLRSHRAGESKIDGFLEDYAYFTRGLIDLFHASQKMERLTEALEVARRMCALFWDEKDGAFFTTGSHQETLIARLKDSHDGATPSGNAVAAEALLRLSALTGDAELQEKGEAVLSAFAASMERAPSAHCEMLSALDMRLHPPKQIALVGRRGEPALEEALSRLGKAYLPGVVVAAFEEGEAPPLNLSFTAGKTRIDGKPAFYVCENYACKQPVTEPDELEPLLLE